MSIFMRVVDLNMNMTFAGKYSYATLVRVCPILIGAPELIEMYLAKGPTIAMVDDTMTVVYSLMASAPGCQTREYKLKFKVRAHVDRKLARTEDECTLLQAANETLTARLKDVENQVTELKQRCRALERPYPLVAKRLKRAVTVLPTIVEEAAPAE
jgi:hypothetical protein